MGAFIQPAGRNAWETGEEEGTATKEQFVVVLVADRGGWARMEPI